MIPSKLASAVTAAMLLSGCTTDKVVFVTSTSLGINLDTTPATISVAYDRTEGYAAPAYRSGTLPPVMASIETDGSAIAPEIRQVYATGPAAVIVAGGQGEEPRDLTGRRGRLAFVGTSTTVGLKASFTTGVPESLNFGYKRKEFSYVPLGCQDGGSAACDASQGDLYPSVIGAFDTTVRTPSASGTMLRTRQFVATGSAAAALAPKLQPEFARIAKRSVAFEGGRLEATAHLARVESVVAYVAPAGSFDQAKYQALVATANANAPGSVGAATAEANTVPELRRRLNSNAPAATALEAALPRQPNP